MVTFTEQYSTEDKSTWERGPWDDEPDKVVWVDEQTSLDCMAVRNRAGAWCGYVGVPEGHPAFGKHYDDVAGDVHGGLTYAGPCQETDDPADGVCHLPQPGRPAPVWWLGFDCAHGGDQVPAYWAALRRVGAYSAFERDCEVYRDLGYVVGEVERLAAQLHADDTLVTQNHRHKP
jgi:hypothetical protein